MNDPLLTAVDVPQTPEGGAIHPEMRAEQEYIDKAHAHLDAARDKALRLTSMVEVGQGGTNQARFEREAIYDQVLQRLKDLQVGDASLVFGRIDQVADAGGDRLYIGRIGVWDDTQDPVVVDWRAPASEPFYRATGVEPLGLERRRHFATRGQTLLGIEDELFGDLSRLDDPDPDRPLVVGQGALFAALEASRTGRLGDIVGTIQGEQDEIIRAPMAGVLAVQGGPGTGKTVVALHRAAYLLYTNRFPLDGQGVIVIGPNRLFLAYIEQVLPSLGEAGVELATLGDLVSQATVSGLDAEAVARVKGDLRMVGVVRRAVRARERALRDDFRIGYGVQHLTLTVDESRRIRDEARRRFRTHNAGRRFVEAEVFAALAASSRDDASPEVVASRLRPVLEVREALEWMWPVLTPAHLLHDLYGSLALLHDAGRGQLERDEIDLLHRPRSPHADEVVWTVADAPLLDEAREVLGHRPGHKDADAVRTYGHIVVDEVQDLSPMELRMVTRRSLNGSLTVVGDIAQATGAWAHESWAEILEQLPDRRPPRQAELTIGYRIPAPAMALAARVLEHAAPGLAPPRAVRDDGDPPEIRHHPGDVTAGAVAAVRHELTRVGTGNVTVVVPASLVDGVREALRGADIVFGGATRSGLDHQLAVVPVGLVKGLEVDSVVVVEPARIVSEEAQGLRALYVALTRATKRVSVVHSEPLPAMLRE